MDTTDEAQAGTPFAPEVTLTPAAEDAPVAKQARADEPDDEGPQFTIDELAAETGVPSRTIRFYQAKGALPAPERRGRVAYYGPSHVERLRLVAELQDRGLHLKAIRDLVTRADSGDVSVSDWLGVGEKLRAPWTDDRPRMVTEGELLDLVSGRRGLVGELLRTGLIRPEGDAMPPSYVVKSPGLLQVALRLDAAGVDVELASEITDILRRRVARAADDLVSTLTKQAKKNVDRDFVSSVEALRSVGLEAVRLVFAQEMERSLRRVVEKGDLVPAGSKKERASRHAARTAERVKKRAEQQAERARDRADRHAAKVRRKAARLGRKG